MYFYNLDARDDDRGLSSVIKDVGTFFRTDGKTSPVVTSEPCVKLTYLLLSHGRDSNCRIRGTCAFQDGYLKA